MSRTNPMNAAVDPNRKLVHDAISFVRAHAGAGDEEAISILHDYIVKAGALDIEYRKLPEAVAAQLTFRDELPVKLRRFVDAVREFYYFTYGDVYDEFHAGRAKSAEFQAHLDRIRVACDRMTAPWIDAEGVKTFIDGDFDAVPAFAPEKFRDPDMVKLVNDNAR